MVLDWDLVRADPRTLRLEAPRAGYAEMLVWPLGGDRAGFALVAVAGGRVGASPPPVGWAVDDPDLAGLLAGSPRRGSPPPSGTTSKRTATGW